jgi:plasmid stabilization system protein ParE
VSEPLEITVSLLAAGHIRAAETWWRINRPKAPNAIREDLEGASSLIAAQPEVGARAQNVVLPGVRRLHLARIRYDLYYRLVDAPRRLEILAFWHASRGSSPPI